MILPDFGVHFSQITLFDFSEENKTKQNDRYVIPSALVIMAEVDFFFGSLFFKSYEPKPKWTYCSARTNRIGHSITPVDRPGYSQTFDPLAPIGVP